MTSLLKIAGDALDRIALVNLLIIAKTVSRYTFPSEIESRCGRFKGSTTISLVKTGNRKNHFIPYAAASG